MDIKMFGMTNQYLNRMTMSENNIFLFKVERQFVITDRGLVLAPGLGDKVKLVTTGAKIKLVRPEVNG
jgi:hypothetical protein